MTKKCVKYFKIYFKFDLLFLEITTINTHFLAGRKLLSARLNCSEKEPSEIILYGELINENLFLVLPHRISIKRKDIIQAISEDFKDLLIGLLNQNDDLLGLLPCQVR